VLLYLGRVLGIVEEITYIFLPMKEAENRHQFFIAIARYFCIYSVHGGKRHYVEETQIIEVLTHLDAQLQKPYIQARSLEPLAPGKSGSEAWRCKAEDGRTYAVKAQNNGQDRNQPRQNDEPLKILTTELICGRIGQLFNPIICPEVAVIDIPEKLAAASTYPLDNRQVASGPSFGSLWYHDMLDVKFNGRIDLVPPDQIARIIVYQTWLRGEDIAALVSSDGRKAISIDHGYYLSGPNWDRTKLANPLHVPAVVIAPQRLPIDSTLFQPVLEELRLFSELDILQAFASIPPEWGGTISFRAMLASMILQRRTAVEQTISTIWREVRTW
jgi:HipA-like kinase